LLQEMFNQIDLPGKIFAFASSVWDDEATKICTYWILKVTVLIFISLMVYFLTVFIMCLVKTAWSIFNSLCYWFWKKHNRRNFKQCKKRRDGIIAFDLCRRKNYLRES